MSSVVVGVFLTSESLTSCIYSTESTEITTSVYENGYIEGYVEQLIKNYENALAKIALYDQNETLDKDSYFQKYGDLVYFATRYDTMPDYYISHSAKFTVGDWFLFFQSYDEIKLCQCKNISEKLLILEQQERKSLRQNQEFTFEAVAKEFRTKIDQIYIVVDMEFGQEFYDKARKTNCLNVVYMKYCSSLVLIARMLIDDPDIQYVIQIDCQQENESTHRCRSALSSWRELQNALYSTIY